MIKTVSSVWYFVSFIIGVLLVVFYVGILSDLPLLSVGAATYFAFFIFILAYFLLGFALNSLLPGKSVALAFFLALPMWLLLYPLNFGDYGPREVLPRWLAALSPFAACLGALVHRQVYQSKYYE